MTKNKVASVLAKDKNIVPSDAFLFECAWENRLSDSARKPLTLIEKSVRGTISNRLKAALKNDPAKLDAEVEKANLQMVDSCSLGLDSDTLCMKFTVKFLSGIQYPSACNDEEYREKLINVIEDYIKETGCTELASRYAVNLANGRFLWRNRVGAEAIEIHINSLTKDITYNEVFDAKTLSLQNFDQTDKVSTLAALIANTFTANKDYLLLEITAFAKIGFAQAVYPSEELVLDKSNSSSKKSKILYAVNGVAALHSQKVGNAIRTIDTWYPDDEAIIKTPIAAEPYGAVTSLGKAFRTPKQKKDFFTLFDQWVLDGDIEELEDKHYVVAVLIRGGVFGESGKD